MSGTDSDLKAFGLLSIPFGTVAVSKHGDRWGFLGCRKNSCSWEYHFAEEVIGKSSEPRLYNAVMLDTLFAMFPELAAYANLSSESPSQC